LREERARHEVERLATELQRANQQLRTYAAQVEELATTTERNRLAREIHDSLGHYLTVMNVQLGAAQAVFDSDPEKARDALQKAQRLAQEGLADVRRSVAALREKPVGDRPLPDAIEALVEETASAGIDTAFSLAGTPRPVQAPTELTLYRAAQEGLTNAQKHARPEEISVTLVYEEAHIRLVVADDGHGADDGGTGGFGLLGLRERVELLGGRVTAESAPGEGFVLTVVVPG
jgi:signal transduction histidine kinase